MIQGQGVRDLLGLPHPRSCSPSQTPWEETGLARWYLRICLSAPSLETHGPRPFSPPGTELHSPLGGLVQALPPCLGSLSP